MTITYGLLDKALRGLGLIRHLKDEKVIYSSEENIPLIAYPQRPDSETVSPWHLSMARHSVVEMGLAEAPDFERALEQAA
jgi:hypothetical protein